MIRESKTPEINPLRILLALARDERHFRHPENTIPYKFDKKVLERLWDYDGNITTKEYLGLLEKTAREVTTNDVNWRTLELPFLWLGDGKEIEGFKRELMENYKFIHPHPEEDYSTPQLAYK